MVPITSLTFPDSTNDPKGKGVMSQVVTMQNSFHALPSVDKVGSAMDFNEAIQGTNSDIDFIEDQDDKHNEFACGPSARESPPSSR